MKFIEKKHYTFDELTVRWECGLNDLVQAVIGGELIPCVHINGTYSLCLFTANNHADGWLKIDSVSEGDCSAKKGRTGFHYLISPRRTGVADCEFSHFSENATDHHEGDICYELISPLGIKHVLEEGVFMSEEVARVESTYDNKSEEQTKKKQLSTKERDTLLTIIAVLAKHGKIEIKEWGKSAQFISGLTDEMGVHVSKRAIEDHLKKIPDALEVRMK